MKTVIVKLPEIAIIGKEGLCTKERNIVKDLWNETNSHFAEIADLGMKEEDGSYVGFWGAMSDETMSFQPWTEDFSRGLYLAGLEVYKDAVPPSGFKKWILPARTYLMVDVDMESYGKTFTETINRTIPDLKARLCGAVCDYTKPSTGQNSLLFPIEEL